MGVESSRPAVNARDIGIDLVGTNADGPGYTAIQCKLYARNASVPKAGIDSFLAASAKPFFTRRFLVATNEKWSENVANELHQQTIPVTLITRRELETSVVDWSEYLKSGRVVERPKRTPRPYQLNAIANVVKGFETADRGKLIMACGTGKTFTSMKIAEESSIYPPPRGNARGRFVLFLVPSLSLLSQTLSDWKQQCSCRLNAFAVCSDASTGKTNLEDIEQLTVGSELAYPATTDAKTLADRVTRALDDHDALTVVFSTYHSIDVLHEAQQKYGMDDFGLIICDEAHRTAGGHYVEGEEDSPFQRIHDANYVRGRKRLYMTATPKIYGGEAKAQQDAGEVVLYSMDDEKVFGKTFHTISFSEAVRLGSLVDYKVIVLTIEENVLNKYADGRDDLELVRDGGLPVKHAAKVIGCWRALSKVDLKGERSISDDIRAMKRAVGFAQIINAPTGRNLDRTSSKLFAANFENVVEAFKKENFLTLNAKDPTYSRAAYAAQYPLECDCKHIDGSMNATEKTALLDWLREEPAKNRCKILFNVRCLSEGVDVPALDAVLFLSPRKSQVEVVQTVGRVMRIAPNAGKKRGYVILPVVTPPGLAGEDALNNNKEFDVVWQVLRALKSIDNEFGAAVDPQLGKINSDKIEVVSLTEKKLNKKPKAEGGTGSKGKRGSKPEELTDKGRQGGLFERDEVFEEHIRSRILKRVGNRREWGDWAEDVGDFCKQQIVHIKKVLSENETSRKAFESFKKELKATLNGDLSDDEIVEMLGQHVVTQPILDALFTIRDDVGNVIYEFSKHNPIARAMTAMVDSLDKDGMRTAAGALKDFYESVQIRMRNVKTAAERQTVIKDLFEKFFKAAFPKLQEKLGIVYTPVEVVDFINRSVADLMKQEFGTNLYDDGVHILDPFSGTGTFLARLMQSGLIPQDKLPKKFATELHGNEIVPLAYYVASMNLEGVFHELCPSQPYAPNNVMLWMDTFADHSNPDVFKTALGENNQRLETLAKTDVRVILGNPPYSVGQDSQNDDNQNDHYEELDNRLMETYVARTNSTLKGKIYDSYIRAYRWASDRIGDKGIIGFVTNAGWLDSSSADGMRKCMAEEFNSIYIYHLKGNQRTSGERSRQEGGKIFGEGSRSPVAIVFLVKNPESKEFGRIYFHAVDDYLTREEKLQILTRAQSIASVGSSLIVPDEHGDWFNLREGSFSRFIRIDGKKTKEKSIFRNFSLGVFTSRDVWAYSSCREQVVNQMQRSIDFYNSQVEEAISNGNDFSENFDPKLMKWDRPQKRNVRKGEKAKDVEYARVNKSFYRPFFRQYLYFDRFWNNCVYQMPTIFPSNSTENLMICFNQAWSGEGQLALMANRIVDLHFNGDSQCFPRWIPKSDTPAQGILDLGYEDDRESGFSKDALPHFQKAYPGQTITETDLFYYIYGILHSEDYRTRFANNLMKELPRIPRVATYEQFRAFADAGRKLADLHVNYEHVAPYAGVKLVKKEGNADYRVTQMKWGKIPGKKGNAAKDKTRLVYNDWLTIENIPLEAQEYVVNKKSALDWVVERACVSTDAKSGIVNDFNDYAAEIGNPRYPLELVLKVITVSLETMKIVKGLPPLEIHPLDA